MIFVIGGKDNGKLKFVLEKYNLKDRDVYYGDGTKEYNNETVIYNFHLIIKKLIKDGKSQKEILDYVKDILKKEELIIISNEIGYGIVPIEKEDRLFRESCGRICCYIAKEAEEVYRIVYGIGTKIKGSRF